MENYAYFNIPRSCEVGNTIFKRLFYENTDLPPADKKLFTDTINKITWLYCLKPETINIKPYKDDIRDYPEIEVIEVEIANDIKLRRITEIIMRTIPYPMVLIYKLGAKTQLYVAHQKTNQNDSSKNTIEEFIATDWLNNDSSLFEKLDIKQMRFTNFYAMYSDMLDAISIYNISRIMPYSAVLSGEEARLLSSSLETLEQEITSLKVALKKETQFNRKMELNIDIKKLEKEQANMIGEFKNDRN